MFLKDRGCILRQTALPGRGKIIQLWLEREGPVSAVVFPGKKAAVHPALLQPLQMFDFELKAPGRGSHYTIREIKPLREIQDIKFINESHLMIFHLTLTFLFYHLFLYLSLSHLFVKSCN